MSYRIRFLNEAAEEVENERAWYRKRSLEAEESFLRELDHAVSIVLEAPERWPAYLHGTQRYVFPVFPFALIYFVDGDSIVIVAIANERMKPGYWQDRIRKRR